MLLYLYTKLFINMIILYYQMCLNSEQDFTASPHEIFHETSLGPDALFITTKKFLFNYKVVFQYIYVKHILLNYSYPRFKRCSLNSTKKIPRFNSLLKCPRNFQVVKFFNLHEFCFDIHLAYIHVLL